ncbi:O-antigen ligase family protein [Gordonia alkanivorans]|uniref:O-antigen ligase family protein n=1 Tax=Gordonia alkanivorans TaxID=84096 RepID=UPI0024499A2B|nr:O-antigen ligase family protein [Gordonia alkanivorans]MDH3012548.1 O-antigen ligase family protein [Gordonia alkanivorans]
MSPRANLKTPLLKLPDKAPWSGMGSGGLGYAALTAGIFGLGVGVAFNAVWTGTAVVGAIFVALILVRPNFLMLATYVTATVALPEAVPMSFPLLGLNVQIYEPLALASVCYILAVRRRQLLEHKRIVATIALVGFAILYGAVLGIARGNDTTRVFNEARPLLETYAAIVIGCFVVCTPDLLRLFVRATPYVLVVSCAITIAASAQGFAVGGQQTEMAGSTAEVSRIVTPATYLAVACVCGCLCLYVSRGGRSLAKLWTILLPALPLVILPFSRNVILGLAAAALFAIVARRTLGAVGRTAVAAALVALSGLGFRYLGLSLATTPMGKWVNNQFELFETRVIGGLTGKAIEADGSAQFRLQQENPYLFDAIEESPVVGHGLGYAYKPLLTGRALNDRSENLQYYAHDLYLWLMVKLGPAGTVAFLLPMLASIVSTIIRPTKVLALFCGGAVAGFLAISTVAPLPLTVHTCFVFGLFGGLLVGATCVRNPGSHQPGSFVEEQVSSVT